ncbi:MAG: hypothetical protein KDD09_27335, partial [Phaeodactylibacter sp.]|nr:hypothetical protein [Phaeodactylibacter sp.]
MKEFKRSAIRLRLPALSLLFLAFAISLSGQNRQDLENRRQQLLMEIKDTEALLKETKKDKAATLDQYLAL